jgi:hypothetical protein
MNHINWHNEALNFMRDNGIPHQELPCGFIERAMQHGAGLIAGKASSLVGTALKDLQRRHAENCPPDSGMSKTIEVHII